MARRILRPNKRNPLLIRDAELRRQKREAVANAAFDLFLRDGFHRTTTRDIARRAGVSAGAVFTYFRNKEEILFYLLSQEQERAETQLLEMLRQRIQETVRTGIDPEEVFLRVFTAFLRVIDHMRRFILLAYQETKSLNQQARQQLIAREKRLEAVLGEAIRYGVDRGHFAPGNIALKAHTIMVLAHAWAVRHWAFSGRLHSVEDYIAFLQPQVLAMLKNGVGVAEAPKREHRRSAVNGMAEQVPRQSVP